MKEISIEVHAQQHVRKTYLQLLHPLANTLNTRRPVLSNLDNPTLRLAVHFREMLPYCHLEPLVRKQNIAHGRAHALHALGRDETLCGRVQVMGNHVQIRAAEKTSAVVQRSRSRQLVR